MKNKLSIRDLNLEGKRVLIRVDFNVPLEKGKILDDTRIRASLPTIQYVLDHGGAAILMSHLGRPKGEPSVEFSLLPCAKHLADLIKKPVKMAPNCIGPEVEKMVKDLRPGEILLLENLRFHPGEEKPDTEPNFAPSLARLGDVYVNDAFGTAHRVHASTATIAQFFPGKAATGFLMEKEIQYLGTTLLNPKRPFYAILGGAKISTKFKVIEALMKKADALLIGGAMAYTFFKAEGIAIGNSLCENDFLNSARQLLSFNRPDCRCRLLLPIDIIVTRQVAADAESYSVNVEEGIPEGWEGVDIGPKTIELFAKELQNAATVFWNGPLGVFECPPFAKGTNTIARVLANLNATTIIGGGDSASAIEAAGLTNQISHISTGGGASLEYIELGQLPGIEVLSDKQS